VDFKPLPAVYLHSCPNCGGAIKAERLAAGLPCDFCLPRAKGSLGDVLKRLEEEGRLEGLGWVRDMLQGYEEIAKLFEAVVGFKMWGAQRLWAKRLARGRSFAVVAPTGSGKTTFLLIAALYMAKRGKALLIFPTSALAYQAHKRLSSYEERARALGYGARVLAYHSMLKDKEKEEVKRAVEAGEFDVLITTSASLVKYFDLLARHKYAFIATDDVDSVLRATSKNIDRILKLLGVTDEALRLANEAIEAAKEANKALLAGDEKAAAEAEERARKRREELRAEVKRLGLGVFIASGALAKARRTARLLLFREILGFDVGGRAEGLRNVYDLYLKLEDPEEQVLRLVEDLGGGGIIYVLDRDLGKKIAQRLSENDIRAEHFFRPRRKVLEAFERREVKVLVGLASSRSALVRGIDLPHVIRYVIFVGIPKFKFRVRVDEFSIPAYLSFLYNVRPVLPQELKYRADRLIAQLKRLAPYSASVERALREGPKNSFEEYAAKVANSAVEFVGSLLAREDVRKAIESSTEVKLAYIDGQLYVLLPDVTTYIQGSGRTSRLYAGGLSKGISIVLYDDEKVLEALRREMELRFDDVAFKDLSKLSKEELGKMVEEVDRDRETIKRILSGQLKPEELSSRDLMRSILLIVESPTKAKTIASFFGRPNMLIISGMPAYEVSTGDAMLTVIATLGHVFELPTGLGVDKKGAYKVDPRELERLRKWFGLRGEEEYKGDYNPYEYAVIKTEEGFVPVYNRIYRCPGRVFVDDSELAGCEPLDVIGALRSLAAEADLVYLGSDPDSEGEKIAYDVYLMLKPYAAQIRRVEFHEITRRAIINALASPRDVNTAMVAAQIIRRVEDRWLGFGLSRKVQEVRESPALSAGRVQTPVLGWVVSSYEESRRKRLYDVVLSIGGAEARLAIPEDDYKALRKAERPAVVVEGGEESVEEVAPPPPYTTDEYLRDAVNRLGISAEEAMAIAQDLFESGFITYHRTDSTRVSPTGIGIAKEYITRRFGESAFRPRPWAAGEEGAHEAIRPTRPIDAEELRGLVAAGVIQPAVRLTRNHMAAYDLIFRRFMASQMEPAEVVAKKYVIKTAGGKALKELKRYIDVRRQGFLAMYQSIGVERPLPEGEVEVEVKYAKRLVELLSQADVLRMMRERGIGRPSTYARTLEVLRRRGYVVVRGRRKFLIPTRLGIEVYRFLSEKYAGLVNEERTKLVEDLMDSVERGSRDYRQVLQELFEEFRGAVLKG
jgi:reverse gyrase